MKRWVGQLDGDPEGQDQGSPRPSLADPATLRHKRVEDSHDPRWEGWARSGVGCWGGPGVRKVHSKLAAPLDPRSWSCQEHQGLLGLHEIPKPGQSPGSSSGGSPAPYSGGFTAYPLQRKG